MRAAVAIIVAIAFAATPVAAKWKNKCQGNKQFLTFCSNVGKSAWFRIEFKNFSEDVYVGPIVGVTILKKGERASHPDESLRYAENYSNWYIIGPTKKRDYLKLVPANTFIAR
jgi:hypothetical protein